MKLIQTSQNYVLEYLGENDPFLDMNGGFVRAFPQQEQCFSVPTRDTFKLNFPREIVDQIIEQIFLTYLTNREIELAALAITIDKRTLHRLFRKYVTNASRYWAGDPEHYYLDYYAMHREFNHVLQLILALNDSYVTEPNTQHNRYLMIDIEHPFGFPEDEDEIAPSDFIGLDKLVHMDICAMNKPYFATWGNKWGWRSCFAGDLFGDIIFFALKHIDETGIMLTEEMRHPVIILHLTDEGGEFLATPDFQKQERWQKFSRLMHIVFGSSLGLFFTYEEFEPQDENYNIFELE